MPKQPTISPVELAKILGISKQTVYNRVHRGQYLSRTIKGKIGIVLDPAGKPVSEDSIPISVKPNQSQSIDSQIEIGQLKTQLAAKEELINQLQQSFDKLEESYNHRIEDLQKTIGTQRLMFDRALPPAPTSTPTTDIQPAKPKKKSRKKKKTQQSILELLYQLIQTGQKKRNPKKKGNRRR